MTPQSSGQSRREINTSTNIASFSNCLSNVNWNCVLSNVKPNEAFNMFHSMFSKLYDKYFPIKKVRTKVIRKNKCWMTAGLIKSVNYKHRLYKKMLNNPSVFNSNKFRLYRNKLNALIKKCKLDYYQDKFMNAKNDAKKTWNVIKTILNKSNSANCTAFKKISHNGRAQ